MKLETVSESDRCAREKKVLFLCRFCMDNFVSDEPDGPIGYPCVNGVVFVVLFGEFDS